MEIFKTSPSNYSIVKAENQHSDPICSVYKRGKLSPREVRPHTPSPRALVPDTQWQLGSLDTLWPCCLGLCLGSKESHLSQKTRSLPPALELNSMELSLDPRMDLVNESYDIQ